MKNLLLLIILLVVPALGLTSEADSDGPITRALVWPDGTRYVGGVLDGKRSGKGTIFWQDGTRFVGQFENDLRNGPGTMILPDGTVYTGFFENDELVDTEPTLSARQSDKVLNEVETTTALGDTELPMEADSLAAPPAAITIPQSDENDLGPVAQSNPADSAEPATVTEPIDEDVDMSPKEFDASFDEAYSRDVTSVTDAIEDELIEAINLWGTAWSDQNVPQYLSNYSDEFKMPSNQSRRVWEAVRRTRLTKPHYINLNIDYEDFELVDTNIVDVLFRQAYRSNTYSDLTDKVLRMRKEGTDWKILLERSR